VTEAEVPVIFAVHARALASKAARLWHYRIPAEDLAQIASLSAVMAFRSYDPALLVPLHLWIKRKMAGAVFDAVRTELHLMRRTNSACTEAFDTTRKEIAVMASATEWPAVEAAMDIPVARKVLNSRQSEVIERRYFRGETLREIASDLGIHLATVSQIETAACLKMRGAFRKAPRVNRYATATA
jgi:RNA polymerase sigma factor (sigma-70 family)